MRRIFTLSYFYSWKQAVHAKQVYWWHVVWNLTPATLKFVTAKHDGVDLNTCQTSPGFYVSAVQVF